MEFVSFVGVLLLISASSLFFGFRIKNRPARALLFALAGLCVAGIIFLALNVENSGGGTRVPPTASVLVGSEGFA